MTQQSMFGGSWTQQKLEILKDYLRAYRKIFEKNVRAQYFRVLYIDAFAGTGVVPRPEIQGTFAELIPNLAMEEEEFRKGSVRRALEISPAFHRYIFIERDSGKCEELSNLRTEFPDRNIEVRNDDANAALLKWCKEMDTKRERAVIFLDPFGAAVDWKVIEAIAMTKAADLWILFPFAAVNRMLTRGRKPPASWSEKLTRVFGTATWETEFYSSRLMNSVLSPDDEIELVRKIADPDAVVEFFAERLRKLFPEVARPGRLFNSRSLLFVLLFASNNKAGVNIANHLLRDIAN